MTSGSLALAILDAHAGFRRLGGDEQLVLRHLAEPDHRRRADAMVAEDALALDDDQPVGGASVIVTDRFGSTVSSFAEYQPVP